jgi:hypothetical protein
LRLQGTSFICQKRLSITRPSRTPIRCSNIW